VRAHIREVKYLMTTIDRRVFLRTGAAVAGLGGLAAACTTGRGPAPSSGLIGPASPQVAAAEAKRLKSGRTRTHTLAAAAGVIDLGGPAVQTWSYGGRLPGREIRVTKGDVVEARLINHLPAETTIHWHGVAIRDNADGVPAVTQAAVQPGGEFTYRFTAAEPGTYWFHPHVGVQLDRGLYAPLIVEDPGEPARYDHDWVVVLDDWVDGTGRTPDQVLAGLRQGMTGMGGGMGGAAPSPHRSPSMSPGMTGMASMGAMSSPTMSSPTMGASPGGMSPSPSASSMPGTGPGRRPGRSRLLGGDAGDVRYPHYLINGRVPAAPRTFRARPGQRARIRFINAGGDTAFRVALGGHRLTVTHTDGYPVAPLHTGALLIGMGERYDVRVTLGDGVFPLAAAAVGKNATALALVRTGAGRPPHAGVRPSELDGSVARYQAMRPAAGVALPARAADVTHRLVLTGGMARYDWGINGQPYNQDNPQRFGVREGQRVRVVFSNTTAMYHPMHIHGHTFQINGTGPRKDTVIVLPGQQVTCDLDAGNPGQWMTHCHNIYHAESGMMALLGYQT
jgi:FtsP/CotA-like multicopper oxidase with cupredoxin domain